MEKKNRYQMRETPLRRGKRKKKKRKGKKKKEKKKKTFGWKEEEGEVGQVRGKKKTGKNHPIFMCYT